LEFPFDEDTMIRDFNSNNQQARSPFSRIFRRLKNLAGCNAKGDGTEHDKDPTITTSDDEDQVSEWVSSFESSEEVEEEEEERKESNKKEEKLEGNKEQEPKPTEITPEQAKQISAELKTSCASGAVSWVALLGPLADQAQQPRVLLRALFLDASPILLAPWFSMRASTVAKRRTDHLSLPNIMPDVSVVPTLSFDTLSRVGFRVTK